MWDSYHCFKYSIEEWSLAKYPNIKTVFQWRNISAPQKKQSQQPKFLEFCSQWLKKSFVASKNELFFSPKPKTEIAPAATKVAKLLKSLEDCSCWIWILQPTTSKSQRDYNP